MRMLRRDITCVELVEVATEWMEGALSDERRAAVSRHLTACKNCTTYIAQLLASVRILRRSVIEPPAAARSAELLAAFRAERAS